MLRVVLLCLVLANALYFAWSQGGLAFMGLAPASVAEPQRLQTQLRPDSLRLLNAPRPSAPPEPSALPASGEAEAASPPATSTAASTSTSTTASTSAEAKPPAPGLPPETAAVAAAPKPASPAAETVRKACWAAAGFTETQADALRSALRKLDTLNGNWQIGEVRLGGRWVVYMGRFDDAQLKRKKEELDQLKVEYRDVSPPALGLGLALGTFSSEEAAEQALRDLSRKGVRSARVAVERPEGRSYTLRLPAITSAQRSALAGLGPALAGKRLQPCD